MKLLTIFVITLAAFSSMAQKQKSQSKAATNLSAYANEITADELSAHLMFIASDFMQGRRVGTHSERAAAMYLASHYKGLAISPVKKTDQKSFESYFQTFGFARNNASGKSQNVLAFVEGTDPVLKNEVVVISAHYDHLGVGAKVENDSIYNGAADDGSGTVVLLEVAEAIAAALKDGQKFKRSLLFFHAGGEESGLLGSRHFVEKEALVDLDHIVANINLDGVGGTDKPADPQANNYVYVLTVDSISSHLRSIPEKINRDLGINLTFPIPANANRFNSDHKSFEYEMIPALYFSTGLTENYHTVKDNPETINYLHMEKIARLVFATTWELLNQPQLKNHRHTFEKTGKFFCPPCGCNMDNKTFDAAGDCPACAMAVKPIWKKK